MNITAIQCKKCLDIIYSRSTHDFKTCSCRRINIDGGFEYTKINGKNKHINNLILDGDKLLHHILFMDWNYHNLNAEYFPNGYHGRFKIVPSSSKQFYNNLVVEGQVIFDEE